MYEVQGDGHCRSDSETAMFSRLPAWVKESMQVYTNVMRML